MSAILGMRIIIAAGLAIGLLSAPAMGSEPTGTKVRVPVLQRAIARGELIGSGDFAIEERGGVEPRDVLSGRGSAGMEAARDLRSGDVVRGSDVVAARLVRRGEPVTIVVRGPGLSISTDGRALTNGAAGDMVRVFSISTNRTLDGFVDGPGTVRIAAH